MGFSGKKKKQARRSSTTSRKPTRRTLSIEVLEDRLAPALVGGSLNFPRVFYDSTGTVNYTASTQEFALDATPLTFTEASASTPINFTDGIGAARDLDVYIQVDNTGNLIGGVAGHDLVLMGSLTVNSITYTSTPTTPLLTGEVAAFGYRNLSATDQYDFRFTVTGGLLTSFYAVGTTIGMTTASENSNFANSFTSNFRGGAKGNIGLVSTVPAATLGNYVWEDLNQDGIQNEPASAGINGVTVRLLDSLGNVVESTITANDSAGNPGYYGFSVSAGTYSVQFEAPSGYFFTQPNVGGNDAIDSEANALGQTDAYVIASGTTNLTIDAGLYRKATLGNFVWNDIDQDGIQDANEPGINGITVNLYSGNTLVATTTTNTFAGQPGYYSFTVDPGTYSVQFVSPMGYVFTQPNVGGNDAIDSDASAVGETGTYTLTSGQVNNTVDAGLILGNPLIDVIKYVSIDGGATWHDANSTTGPTLLSGFASPQFQFVVTNVGNVALTNVTLDDSDFDLNGAASNTAVSLGTLAPNQSVTFNYTGVWVAGQHTNTATTTGNFTDAQNNVQTPTDSDPANYFGARPSLLVTKYVSVDGGSTWLDANDATGPTLLSGHSAPMFKFVVVNDGNVPLSNVTLTDSVYGPVTIPGIMAVGATETVIQTRTWSAGQHTNIATASGSFTDSANNTSSPIDSDPANYFGASALIDVEKLISIDNGTTWLDADSVTGPMLLASGATPKFKFVVTNIGNVTLTGVTLDDSDFDLNGNDTGTALNIGSLTPGASFETILTTVWQTGQHTNTATATGSFTDSVGNTSTPLDQDDANYFGAAPAIDIIKEVSVDGTTWHDANSPTGPTIDAGQTVYFRVKLTNIGNVALSNVNVIEQVTLGTGSPVDFTGVDNTLAVGAFDYSDVVATIAAAGQNTDRATATGSFTDNANNTANPSDNDDANYFGLTTGIGDFVWEDANRNGIQDNGEVGISGATVKLFNSGNVQVGSDYVTNSSGYYAFTGLNPGSYFVEFTLPGGYFFTHQDQGSDATDSDADTTTGRTAAYTFVGGPFHDHVDTGAYRKVTLGNFVWNDLDQDGIQDLNEPGINGVTVNLYSGNTLIATTTTSTVNGQPGTYSFNVDPGTYTVQFVAPAGYLFTAPNQGSDDNLDSDANSSGVTGLYTLISGQINNTVDAGLILAAPAIDVEKYVSIDNGLTWQDADTPTGQTLLSTGASPKFKFVVTNTGNVTLSSVILSDSDFDLNGGNPGTTISIGSLASGATYQTIITAAWQAGQHTNTATVTGSFTDSAGNNMPRSDTDDANYFGAAPSIDVIKYVSVNGGATWLDANTATGPTLLSGSAAPMFQFVVANTGNVPLSNVNLTDTTFGSITIPGTLAVGGSSTIFRTDAWARGQHTNTATASGNFTDSANNVAHRSDSDLANYFGAAPSIDLIKEVSVNGTTWIDANSPMGPSVNAGQTVYFRVKATNTGNVPLSSVSVSDQITLGTGSPVHFTGVMTSLNVGAFDYSDVVTTVAVSGQNTNKATVTSSFTDGAGTTIIPSDNDDANYFGVVQNVMIGDYVWEDRNYDGIQNEPSNAALAGVTVKLLNGSTVVATTTTNSSGFYSFSVNPGTYSVEFVAPSGYLFTQPNQGANDALDSDANSSGFTGPYTVASGSNLTVDAGLYRPVTISGKAFCDNDLDGIRDGNEYGEQGAIVSLYDSTGALVATRTTDAYGHYSFGGLTPGTYTVKLTTPSTGHLAEVSHGTVIIPAGLTSTLQSNGIVANQDFPLIQLGSISGYVYVDINDSCIRGDITGEVGISGVKLTLTGTDYAGASVTKTVYTDSTGKYAFSGLLPSNSTGYTITEIQPAGFADGLETVGTLNGVVVGARFGNDGFCKIVLPGCDNNAVNYNFGELGIYHGLTATIGFWHNGNGQELIKSFAKTTNGLTLANWLATTYPNLFGKNAPAFKVSSTIGTNLTNRSNADVANYFLSLFAASGQKAYAQVLATAFSVFTTTNSLNTGSTARGLAAKHGFILSNGGAGAALYVVPSASWPAFGITSSSNATKSITQLLSLANSKASKGKLNAGNTTQITQTNNVFDTINNLGDIISPLLASSVHNVGADTLGFLSAGTYLVSIGQPTGKLADGWDLRIVDALNSLNDTLGNFGVNLIEYEPETGATPDIFLNFARQTPIGGKSDGVLAVAENGGRITIVTGWDYFMGADARDIGSKQYDFQTIVTHELGHAVGLGHSADSDSVMYPFLSKGAVRRNLSAGDLALLEATTHDEMEIEALMALVPNAPATPTEPTRRPEAFNTAFLDFDPTPGSPHTTQTMPDSVAPSVLPAQTSAQPLSIATDTLPPLTNAASALSTLADATDRAFSGFLSGFDPMESAPSDAAPENGRPSLARHGGHASGVRGIDQYFGNLALRKEQPILMPVNQTAFDACFANWDTDDFAPASTSASSAQPAAALALGAAALGLVTGEEKKPPAPKRRRSKAR